MNNKLKSILRLGTSLALTAFTFSTSLGQCESWENYPADKGGLEEAVKQHVIYRDALKAKKYEEALNTWKLLLNM